MKEILSSHARSAKKSSPLSPKSRRKVLHPLLLETVLKYLETTSQSTKFSTLLEHTGIDLQVKANRKLLKSLLLDQDLVVNLTRKTVTPQSAAEHKRAYDDADDDADDEDYDLDDIQTRYRSDTAPPGLLMAKAAELRVTTAGEPPIQDAPKVLYLSLQVFVCFFFLFAVPSASCTCLVVSITNV